MMKIFDIPKWEFAWCKKSLNVSDVTPMKNLQKSQDYLFFRKKLVIHEK